MTRARRINVGGVAQAAALHAIAAKGLQDGVTNTAPRVIENRGQAMPKGARIAARQKRTDRRASTRAATAELVTMSNQTLVVAHLHPRWLRVRIERLMDEGANVTAETIEGVRKAGPRMTITIAELVARGLA